jgi:hypothetical protein
MFGFRGLKAGGVRCPQPSLPLRGAGSPTLTDMRTLEPLPHIQSVTCSAPVKREAALTEGDWERAYTLACREDGVQYLVAPAPLSSASRRKKPALAVKSAPSASG